MFLMELKKTWKRPEAFITFFIICILQATFVWNLIPSEEGEYLAAYEKYGGKMDEEWKVRINSTYEEYLNDGNKLRDEMDDYQPDFLVLHDAWCYTDFNSMAENYVKSYQAEMAQRDPAYDTDRISEAYREIEEQSEQLVFGSNTAQVVMIKSLSMISKCVLMFFVLLLASSFTREYDTGMDALLLTSRNGRRKLNYIKLAVCQSSALLVPMIFTGITAAIIYIRTGWAGMDAFIQDFRYGSNTCPYVWNNGKYLSVILLVSLLTCQAAAAVVFVVSRYLKTTVKIICISLAILLAPVLLFQNFHHWLLGLWFSNFIAGEHLWNSFYEFRIGQIYISYWQIAVIQLAVLFAALTFILAKEGAYERFDEI